MITTVVVFFIGAWTGTISYGVAILMSVAAEADDRDEIEASKWTIPSDIEVKAPERVRERERV
jgi:hypothetical protein